MSPFQHGEVFVTDDGAETDLDLGHYERFSESRRNRQYYRKIYSDVLKRERGKIFRKIQQVIPHITNRLKNLSKRCLKRRFVI